MCDVSAFMASFFTCVYNNNQLHSKQNGTWNSHAWSHNHMVDCIHDMVEQQQLVFADKQETTTKTK
jgi:hypothetical protein